MTLPLEKSTSEYVERGFSVRVHNFLNELGFKERGRISLIARWAELTPSAIKNMLDNDRPPRSHALERIIDSMVSEAQKRGKNLSKTTIDSYIRYGTEISNSTLEERNYTKEDKLFIGKVHVAIHEAGKELNVDVFKALNERKLNYASDLIVSFINRTNVEFNSDELKGYIKAVIDMLKD